MWPLKPNVQMYVIGGLAVVVLLMAGLAYWLFGQRDKLIEEKGTLTLAVSTQKAATAAAVDNAEAWKQSASTYKATIETMLKNDTEANKELRRLNDVLAKHDLGLLARSKPGLIERRVNSASDDARRLLESASRGRGAPGAGAATKAPAGPAS